MNKDKFDNVEIGRDSFAQKLGAFIKKQKECPPEFEETYQKHLREIFAKLNGVRKAVGAKYNIYAVKP